MEEQPTFVGPGKLYFCRVEDKDKEPQPLGKAVTLHPGMLTYKDDDEKPSYSPKGFNTTFTGTIDLPRPELLDLPLTTLNRWDVQLERKPGRMPRKMKKAYRSDYSRNTKWVRRANNYIKRRLFLALHDVEIFVTNEQRDRLSDMLSVEMKFHKI